MYAAKTLNVGVRQVVSPTPAIKPRLEASISRAMLAVLVWTSYGVDCHCIAYCPFNKTTSGRVMLEPIAREEDNPILLKPLANLCGRIQRVLFKLTSAFNFCCRFSFLNMKVL